MTKREPFGNGVDSPSIRVDIFFNPDDPRWSLKHFDQIEGVSFGKHSYEHLGELAFRIYEARRHRASFLSVSMLGEPVWDMLLALYCFGARGEMLWVSGLCGCAGVSRTTALRWIAVMEQKGLVVRVKDTTDARRAFVRLSDSGGKLMESYLRSIDATLWPESFEKLEFREHNI